MSEQPEALRLADALEARGFLGTTARYAAAELRRQHKEITQIRAALAAVRFQCEADAKAGEWTTSITKLLDAIKAVEENT